MDQWHLRHQRITYIYRDTGTYVERSARARARALLKRCALCPSRRSYLDASTQVSRVGRGPVLTADLPSKCVDDFVQVVHATFATENGRTCYLFWQQRCRQSRLSCNRSNATFGWHRGPQAARDTSAPHPSRAKNSELQT